MPLSAVEPRATAAAGFALVELLVSMMLMGLMLAGAVSVFSSQNKAYIEEDQISSVEENLRFGMGAVTDTLRSAGYGIPSTNLSSWVPWVSGFTANPLISGSGPQTISIAICFETVATLTSRPAAGATTLSLTSSVPGKALTDLLDTSNQRLILIDGAQNALITSVSSSSVTIDTDPMTTGAQGLGRSYPAGAPVCRVDVKTFSITTDATTGIPWLGMDAHHGAGSQSMVEGISNLTVAPVSSTQYQITLTAGSGQVDPVTNGYITRSLSTKVTLRDSSAHSWTVVTAQ